MTATTAGRRAAAVPAPTATGLSFPRVLRAEWIKLWSLRSTYWTVGLTLAVMVAIGLMMSSAVAMVESGDIPAAAGPPPELVISVGYSFGQITVAVLGVMLMTSEYSTGMIRATLAAVPTRIPVLVAKAVLVAVLGFVLGVLGTVLSYVATLPIVGDAAVDLGDPDVQRVFWGTGLYLAAMGLLGLGVGALLRHTAGAITLMLGLVLFLPTIVQLLMTWQDWFADVYTYLPSTAGEQILTTDSAMVMVGMGDPLEPWLGFAVLMAYVVVALGAAAVLLRRRDA